MKSYTELRGLARKAECLEEAKKALNLLNDSRAGAVNLVWNETRVPVLFNLPASAFVEVVEDRIAALQRELRNAGYEG